jgi:hypothetical protein
VQRCGRHTRAKLLAYGGWVGLCAGSLTWLICGHFGSSFPVFQNGLSILVFCTCSVHLLLP